MKTKKQDVPQQSTRVELHKILPANDPFAWIEL